MSRIHQIYAKVAPGRVQILRGCIVLDTTPFCVAEAGLEHATSRL